VTYACIDIGSNTTRLLVAECRDGRLREIASQRAYTRVGKGLRASGRIPPDKVVDTAEVVSRQARLARELGVRDVVVVATAAVREAANRDELVAAIGRAARVEAEILSDEEEARLAFVGATKTLGAPVPGSVAVIDIGGGSVEIAVGTVADGVSWWRSIPLGSGTLLDLHLKSDPPREAELEAARDEVARAFAGLETPPTGGSVAVGGSARSLRKLVGQELDRSTLARALEILVSARAPEVAERFDLEPERARLLPGGALILEPLLDRVGQPIAVGQGGLREGLILELAGGRRPVSAADGAIAKSPSADRPLASATPSEP
jgi:exopolyphosphatase/guanosine-5'-triphosphate,3'-diphosphate pyrophosphatase